MRKYIEWSDELSVGIQEIDEQHQILVNLINILYEAIIRRTEEQDVGTILAELSQYTVIHFAVEESLMRIFDYPNYEEHKKIHQKLTTQVFELQNKFKYSQESISVEVLHFLRHWLTDHIMGEDKKYAPYLVEKGLHPTWAKQRSWTGKIWNFIKT